MPSARQPSVTPRHEHVGHQVRLEELRGFDEQRRRATPAAPTAPAMQQAALKRRAAPGSASSAVCCERRHWSLSRSVGRHVGERRVLAELQRADVGDDRPAILGLICAA